MWSGKHLSHGGLLLLGMVSALFSGDSFAMSCKATDGGVRQEINLNKQITVPTATLAADTLLWRSQTFTSTFECSDTNNYPTGEDAYFYWDPLTELQNIHESLEVGVTYKSIDFKPIKGNKEVIGPGTECNGIAPNCAAPAISQRITVSYSVYIKATGKAPPSDGKIPSSGSYALFQIDGVGGLNTSTTNGNFRAYITGLSSIRFISCQPKISVQGTYDSTVDFGRIPANHAVVGRVEKTMPFTVTADLTGQGQDCQGQILMASFSTNSAIHGTQTILPVDKTGFGIVISSAAKPDDWLTLNTPSELGYINGTNVSHQYLAGLLWLSDKPEIGPFSATANIDVTFK